MRRYLFGLYMTSGVTGMCINSLLNGWSWGWLIVLVLMFALGFVFHSRLMDQIESWEWDHSIRRPGPRADDMLVDLLAEQAARDGYHRHDDDAGEWADRIAEEVTDIQEDR